MNNEIHDRFIHDIRDHVMTIQLDQDCHRHLRLAIPGSSNQHFNIVTWPGYLSISGDMGSYTFARTQDMFGFFRDPDMTNKINCQYWHEKAVAIDRDGGPKQFSKEKFRDAVLEDSAEWQVRLGDASKIMEEIQYNVACTDVSNIHEAHTRVRDFEASDGNHFQDFDYNLMEWSFHFQWVLKAIVWAIKQYDLEKQERTQRHHDDRVLSGII